jgi:hypothetical protein
MAATGQQVTDYKSYITQELSYYGNRMATKHQIGDKPSFDKEVKFMLLQAFVEIAIWYLDEWDDPDNNGMTVDEFNDIQQHINRIANSFHWLEIE